MYMEFGLSGRFNNFRRNFGLASGGGDGGSQSSHALRSLCNGDQEADHENERLVFLSTLQFS